MPVIIMICSHLTHRSTCSLEPTTQDVQEHQEPAVEPQEPADEPQKTVAQPHQDLVVLPHQDPVASRPQEEQRICRSTHPLIRSGHEINEKGREVRFSRRVRNEPATEPQKTVDQPQDLVVLPHQDPVASRPQEEQRICRSTHPLIGSGHEINEKGREVRFSRRVRNRRKKD
jgi:hypothetical protein